MGVAAKHRARKVTCCDGAAKPACGPEAVELESLYRAGRFLASILDLDELLRAILEEGLDAVSGARGFVGLVNRSRGELEFRITAGQGWHDNPQISLPITDAPGSGITVRVAATGVPYVSNDVRGDPHYVMFFPDVRSEIAVPLVDGEGCTIGVLNIESEEIDAFNHRDLQLLVALANQASIAISVADYRHREAALVQVGNELTSARDPEELYRHIVKCARELLRSDDCSLFQASPEGDQMILRATGESLAEFVGQATYHLGEGLTGWVMQHGAPVRVADVRSDPRWKGRFPELTTDEIEAYLAVPVFQRSGLWGVLRVVRHKPANTCIRNDFTHRDEVLLTTLAGQVGAAITRLRLLDRQLHMERMAAWGEMSARSAHMIGNKVFAIKGQINELEYLAARPELSREEVLDVARRARTSLYALEEILVEFRDFLMATHLDRRPTDLNELVSTLVCETCSKHHAVPACVEAAPGLPPVAADPVKLRRAISELLENAAHHQAESGRIRVVTGPWGAAERERYPRLPFKERWAEAGGAVRVEVIDNGPGIPKENKERLFTPFFTTRAKGMGLGLSIVKGIVDAHDGAIAEVGTEGEGAHFIIILPALKSGEPARGGLAPAGSER